jgi:A/G-specific adenine glycosylase
MAGVRQRISTPLDSADCDLPIFLWADLRAELLGWYARSGRTLPWRSTRDPYAIWVSEIMLQQTQVQTVIPYFERWMAQFPTVADLAGAELQAVLKAWEGLGYYARARNLHRAAIAVVADHQGEFPSDLEAALALPGIGRTTAGGILSAAFDLPLPILDGNVKRVLARLIALDRPPAKALDLLWQVSAQLVPASGGRDINQALMDLGATLCTPKQPDCAACPWQGACQAYNLGNVSQIPMTLSRAPLPHKIIGVAVIWSADGQTVLIDRRKAEGLLGGLWEFPGGKLEPGESMPDCVAREIREELGIEIAVGPELMVLDHAYTHFKVTLHVHHCRYVSGVPQLIECDEVRWVSLVEIDRFPFPRANGRIIEALRQLGGPPVGF